MSAKPISLSGDLTTDIEGYYHFCRTIIEIVIIYPDIHEVGSLNWGTCDITTAYSSTAYQAHSDHIEQGYHAIHRAPITS